MKARQEPGLPLHRILLAPFLPLVFHPCFFTFVVLPIIAIFLVAQVLYAGYRQLCLRSRNMVHRDPRLAGRKTRFLDLPRELRDMVYEYTLSEPDGLFCKCEQDSNFPQFKMYSTMDATLRLEAPEANQLKYVSKQLRAETAGLGVEFNDLTFVSTSPLIMTEWTRYLEFLRHCSERRKRRLRGINLTSTADVSAEIAAEIEAESEAERRSIEVPSGKILELARFCRDNPQTTVYADAHFPGGSDCVGKFLTVAFTKAFYRKTELTPLIRSNSKRFSFAKQLAEHNLQVQAWDKINLPNLRFKIWNCEIDEEDFRKAWRMQAHINHLHEENEVEEWVTALLSQYKQWLETGI